MTGTWKELVLWIVKIQHARSYLEIGVMYGETFIEAAKLVKRAVGVDTRNRLPSGYEFYEMPSDEFFKRFNDKIDVIFIDGDHRFEQAKKDFENSMKILNEGGTIILHDTDPSEAVRFAPTSCADSYKLVDHIHDNHPELDILTFPVSVMGISVVRRKKDRRVLGLL
jgi:predicted O-methyltransferase YrrM